MKHFKNRVVLTLLFLLFVVVFFGAAETLNVGPTYEFETIASALKAATSGDTIQVFPKSHDKPYKENISIRNEGVTLKGMGKVY